ncbi:uncharacterized protein LOC119097914 [Pollicipes pollicipes]|uniref:uncharacterized protein LOC119097914 n=1 Tax=Pollicipes pollicipes TaxID=41117 RepID=UPI00188596B8|nr:uncharacterized protein LOC119097914 [Pollicipes pollicipes]
MPLFEQATRAWSSSTCIRFEKIGYNSCNDLVKKPSFCVGNFGGCWSFVGKTHWGGAKTGKGKPQRISVASNCELDACIHEFGHGLGFQHQQSRPDRDKSISVNWENFKITNTKSWEKTLRGTWTQGLRCDSKQVMNIPTPYDFLSVEQYGTFSFVDDDIRPTFVTKDVRSQWMVDYHRSRGMGPSHYDLYMLNSAYKCLDIWKKSCSKNGQIAPKCANYGFITKQCTCNCPAGFTGPTCKNSTGPRFPLLEKAKCFLEWHYPGIIDLANMDLDFAQRSYANMNFNYMQFCTIIIDTLKAKTRPIIRLDPSVLMVQRRKLIELLHRNEFVTHVLPQLYIFDCRLFFKLFWTSDSSNRLRTECFSSIFNVGTKVTKRKMLSLRSKTRALSMYLNVVYKWSQPSIDFLEAAIKLKLQVVFTDVPQKILRVGRTYIEGPPSSEGPTYLPPTIPIELRLETTTPNIFGLPVPMMFRGDENPRLSFIGWTMIAIGILIFAFLFGVCVSEQLHVKELLKAADRRAALNESLLSSGWVKLRGVDVDDEVRKEREERRARSNWLVRLFGLDDTSSDSSDSEDGETKRELAKEQAQRDREDASSDTDSEDEAKRKWRSTKRKEESDTEKPDGSNNERKYRINIFKRNKEEHEKEKRSFWGRKKAEEPVPKRRKSLFPTPLAGVHQNEKTQSDKRGKRKEESEAESSDASDGSNDERKRRRGIFKRDNEESKEEKRSFWGRQRPEEPAPKRRKSLFPTPLAGVHQNEKTQSDKRGKRKEESEAESSDASDGSDDERKHRRSIFKRDNKESKEEKRSFWGRKRPEEPGPKRRKSIFPVSYAGVHQGEMSQNDKRGKQKEENEPESSDDSNSETKQKRFWRRKTSDEELS